MFAKKNRFHGLFFLFLTCVLCLFMCKGRSVAKKQDSEIKPFAGQQITVLVSSAHIIGFRVLAEAFQKETGGIIKINVVPYMDLKKHILEDFALEKPSCDVYQSFYYNLGELVEKNVLMDLTEHILKESDAIHPNDFIPTVYNAYTRYKNRQWGLPWNGDTHALFYRKSLLAKYGFTPPKTWADFTKINHAITVAEKENATYGSAMMMATQEFKASLFLNRLCSMGGNLLDETGHPTLNSPEAVAVLDMLQEQAKDAMPMPLKTDFEVGVNAFVTGHVAMEEGWLCLGQMSENPDQSSVSGDWGVVPLPTGTNSKYRRSSVLNAGYFIGISNKTQHPEIAKAFILFATRKDIQLAGCCTYASGLNPVRLSVVSDTAYEVFTHGASIVEKTALMNAIAWPTGPQAGKLIEELGNNIASAMKKEKSSQQALNDAQKEWENILAETRRD